MQNLLGALNAYRDSWNVQLTHCENRLHNFHLDALSVCSSLLSKANNLQISAYRVWSGIAVLRRVNNSHSQETNDHRLFFIGENLKWLYVNKCVWYEKEIFTNRV